MSEPELARLRRDVDVIREAAGLTPPFGWRDVRLTLAAVPCGLVILAWAAVGPWDYVAASLLPLGLLALAAAGSQAARRRARGPSRALTNEWLSTGVVALAFAVLILWEKGLGLPAQPVRGAAFITAGAMCLVLALSDRQRRAWAAAAAGLVPFGAALPLCSPQQVAMAGGLALAVAGAVGAGIMAGQLRAAGGDRERAAD